MGELRDTSGKSPGPADPPTPSDESSCALSVVIPCLDAGPWLNDQLEALARERPTFGWEVVVADNGSKDGSVELAQTFVDRLPIRVVERLDCRGASAARNAGVAAARGTRLVFLDADDVIAQGYLESMDAAIRRHGFVAARMDSVSINPAWAVDAVRARREVGLAQGPSPAAASAVLGTTRALFDAVGGFDESFPQAGAEDLDFCWRVQDSNPVTLTTCDAVLHYRLRTDLLGLFRQGRAHGRGDPHLYKKWRARGLDRSPARLVVRRWASAIGHLALGWRGKAYAARGLYLSGLCIGRVEGSIKHRVVFL